MNVIYTVYAKINVRINKLLHSIIKMLYFINTNVFTKKKCPIIITKKKKKIHN